MTVSPHLAAVGDETRKQTITYFRSKPRLLGKSEAPGRLEASRNCRWTQVIHILLSYLSELVLGSRRLSSAHCPQTSPITNVQWKGVPSKHITSTVTTPCHPMAAVVVARTMKVDEKSKLRYIW